jgi:hypothetical protein
VHATPRLRPDELRGLLAALAQAADLGAGENHKLARLGHKAAPLPWVHPARWKEREEGESVVSVTAPLADLPRGVANAAESIVDQSIDSGVHACARAAKEKRTSSR